MAEQISDPKGCLLPPEDWPEVTPVSRVHADSSEWNLIVKAGIDRGMFAVVDESELFVNQLGACAEWCNGGG